MESSTESKNDNAFAKRKELLEKLDELKKTGKGNIELLNEMYVRVEAIDPAKSKTEKEKAELNKSLDRLTKAAKALGQAIPKLASEDPFVISQGFVEIVGAIGSAFPPPEGVIIGVIAAFVSGILGSLAKKISPIDRIINKLKTVLEEYHEAEIREKIAGMLEEFKHAQTTMNSIEGTKFSSDDAPHLDQNVPNNIGVNFLGQLAYFLKKDVSEQSDEAAAEKFLLFVRSYCELYSFRISLLQHKVSLLERMGKTTMSITAQAQIEMDLGEDRKNDLKFLYRPTTPKAAVVASVYSCKDWPLIEEFMTKSLKYFEPVIEIPHHAMLQVKKWKDVCIAFKGKELENNSSNYMVKLDDKKYYKKDWGPILLAEFSKLNNADYYLFEKDDSFSQINIFSIRSESKNLVLSAGLVAVNGGNPYGNNMFLSQIEEKKVIVKVILTENDICLLASQQEPDRFLMMKEFKFGEYDQSRIEFGDGVPDFCGWWRFDIRCDGKSLTTSEFDGTSKNFYNDDCIII